MQMEQERYQPSERDARVTTGEMPDADESSVWDDATVPVETPVAEGAVCTCTIEKRYGRLLMKKRLREQLRGDERYRSALQKEFETGFSLDHPGVVRYVERGDDYLLMEYVDGETLDAFAANNPDFFKSRRNVDRLVGQLLDAVGYLHSHHVLHLDLKPQNVMVTRADRSVRLVDLGFCYTDAFPDTTGHSDRFAAPEQITGEHAVDCRTDIYAIGRILQTMPCADRLRTVVRRCTQADMERRYQTVAEVSAALRSRRRMKAIFRSAAVTIVLAMICFGLTTWLIRPKQTEGALPTDTRQDTLPAPAETIKETARPQIIETAPPPAPTKKDKGDEELETLRRRMRDLVRQSFREQLGAYDDSTTYALYNGNYNARLRDWWGEGSDDEAAAYNRLMRAFWDGEYRQSGKMTREQVRWEVIQTKHWFFYNQYYRMCRNEGLSRFDGRTYHYNDLNSW